MNTRAWWSIIIVLLVVIVGLAWILFSTPAKVEAPVVVNPPVATSTQPLSARVVVTAPKAGAKVSKTFTVSGAAPGPWYFEASFPIQVFDKDNNKIGQVVAQAQSDWMTDKQVPFAATLTVSDYSGLATVVLMRDNPSGLPENDDSVSIPITIQ